MAPPAGGSPGPTPDRPATLTDDHCRALFRSMAAGVSIITTDGVGGPCGMTASAVMSLSMKPPMIVVSLTKGSGTLAALRRSRSFAVHLLRDDQQHIADAFAGRGSAPAKNAAIRSQPVAGPPMLVDALAWATCELVRVVAGGDHRLVIGRLLTAEVADGDPLLWHRSDYRQLTDHRQLVRTA